MRSSTVPSHAANDELLTYLGDLRRLLDTAQGLGAKGYAYSSPMSTTQAAAHLGMKVPTCWNHVQRLVNAGFLVASAHGTRRHWRKVVIQYDVRGRAVEN